MESFLSGEFIDENQSQIPSGYEIIKKYELHAPFSYATILYDSEKSSYLYFIDEIRLTHEEKQIFQTLYHLIEQSLESPDESNDNSHFNDHLDRVLKENEKMFLTHSSTSMEKVKYYLKKDISGFGLIDPLMYDINIEDVSCSGIKKPIYIWHRAYDSIPTNIQFDSEEILNSFVSRIVFMTWHYREITGFQYCIKKKLLLKEQVLQ